MNQSVFDAVTQLQWLRVVDDDDDDDDATYFQVNYSEEGVQTRCVFWRYNSTDRWARSVA